ncbi:hypothetical protein [Nostoc sp. UHCC 0302]|uniref:hypothetical protein n=1 Tax=Nostoc sp. UHCC 0302 TaxID=3134896 RepID=UPI00311CB57E
MPIKNKIIVRELVRCLVPKLVASGIVLSADFDIVPSFKVLLAIVELRSFLKISSITGISVGGRSR